MTELTRSMCESMADCFATAFIAASESPTTHVNITRIQHVLKRTTFQGVEVDRVYLTCLLIKSAPDLCYWRFVIMHPRDGEVSNDLVPVSEWKSQQHGVAFVFRKLIAHRVKGIKEEVDTDAVVFTGPVTKIS